MNGKKVLFASAAADGHFNPLTGVAKYLQEKGYDVRWYASNRYAKKLEQMQIVHYPYKVAKEIHASSLDTDFPDRARIRNPFKKITWDIINFFVARGPEYFVDMEEIRKEFRFDLLVCDNAFTGSVFAKEKFGVPVLVACILPLPEQSKDLPPYGLGMVPSSSFGGKLKQGMLRWMAANVLFKRADQFMWKLMEAHGVQHDRLSVFDIGSRKADLLLQSGSPSFDYYRSDLGANIRFVGPLLPWQESEGRKEWIDARLNRYKNIVLVTQGTVEKDVTKLLVPTLEAFKDDAETLVVCTTGGSSTAQLRKQYPQKNLIIEDFIAFEDVMPYADVYISNGGYGGVLLGITHRLPMVVAGLHEGKNEICARIGYFRYGVNLKTEKPSAKQVRTAVNEVLTHPEYKANVIRLAKEMAGYDTLALFERYVEAVIALRSGGTALAELAA